MFNLRSSRLSILKFRVNKSHAVKKIFYIDAFMSLELLKIYFWIKYYRKDK